MYFRYLLAWNNHERQYFCSGRGAAMFKSDRASSRKLVSVVWRQKHYLGLLLDTKSRLQQGSTGMASICYPGITGDERFYFSSGRAAMFQTDREDSDKHKSNPT